MGAVDAGRTTASRVLDDDCSVAVYPGGSREIFSTDPNSSETKVYLSKRRGFVKLAIAHGAALVPVFVFGEKRCYRRLNVPAPLRDWLLRTWKIPLIVFWGRWFTWYPYAARQTVVFGAPIDTKKHKVGLFLFALVPIRPRWRGERRSLRTFAVVSPRPPLAFNLRPYDAFQLHLTPFDSD